MADDDPRNGSPDDGIAVALSTARQAWPHLELARPDFLAYLAAREIALSERPKEIIEDLYLASACHLNIAGALRAFRERYFQIVKLSVKSFDDSDNFAEEVYQRLSETLFVGQGGGTGKISRYSGDGALAGFVSTTARRIALRLSASAARFQGEEALMQQFSEIREQETTILKMQHREIFNRALSIALRQLPRRERLILRMNLIERVSTTRIAAMYKVSQPTVSRWIQRTAQTIFATVKDLVCDELAIDTRELDSLLLLVRSQIEITISQGTGASSIGGR
jgi:RNA polymerase sigma-70 factor (ECF subfamily)